MQIRTWEMHARAEQGVAAHWAYKDRDPNAGDLPWLNRIVDWQSETSDPDEFMQRLKVDLEQDEVFVFTPKGKVVTPPVDATPIDFAYAIHTEVATPASGPGRAGWCRSTCRPRRHHRDLHLQGGGRGPVTGLAADRERQCRAPRSASGSPGSGGGRH